MKINERLYDVLGYEPYKEPEPGEDYVPVVSTPFEVQQCGKHTVELYYMNEYKDVLKEFTQQGKFAVWSSKDGVNYRLAVEKQYYEQLKELYSVEVNTTWLGFWDDCDLIQTKFSRTIVLPVTLVVVLVFILFANWNNFFKGAKMPDGIQLGFTIGIPLVYLFVMMFLRKNIYNKIAASQQKNLAIIKDHFGENKYASLLKAQRSYIDSYFEADEDEENTSVENAKEETNDITTEGKKETDEVSIEEESK